MCVGMHYIILLIYRWYCHVDDDLYLNVQTLVETLKQYDPSKDCYIGNWKVAEKHHKYNRIPVSQVQYTVLYIMIGVREHEAAASKREHMQ